MTMPFSLISSADVTGTAVYNHAGEHIGTIDHVMIDKISGRIAYAVMSFGGFLGFGEDHHPIPWPSLHYDTERGGYVTAISREQLDQQPRPSSDWRRDRRWEEEAHRHFGVAPYWI